MNSNFNDYDFDEEEEENLRPPDDSFHDQLLNHNHQTHRPRERNSRLNEQEELDDMLLQHIIQLSKTEYDAEIEEEIKYYAQLELENKQKKEAIQQRKTMFANAEKQFQKLNAIDKGEEFYGFILSYLSIFIETGEKQPMDTSDHKKLTQILKNIRLTNEEKEHILTIFIIM